MRLLVVLLAVAGLWSATAYADDEPAGSIIFARGGQLFKVDTRGRGETAIATLPEKASVRALRTDAAGKILLVDLGGKWLWMPLDGTAALAELPCS